jgi:hypothetical protein
VARISLGFSGKALAVANLMPNGGHNLEVNAAGSVRILSLIASCVAVCAGCATVQRPAPPPPILASAFVAPPIGGVIPVLIEVAGPPSFPVNAHREGVCAVNQDANCTPALDPEEAGQRAGGTDKLASVLARDESAAAAVGRSMLSVLGPGLAASFETASRLGGAAGGAGGGGALLLGTAATTATALARGSYLTASPEARHLDQIASYSLASRDNWNWYPNHRKGFVYFPSGIYCRIGITAETTKSPVTVWLDWPGASQMIFDVMELPAGPSTP